MCAATGQLAIYLQFCRPERGLDLYFPHLVDLYAAAPVKNCQVCEDEFECVFCIFPGGTCMHAMRGYGMDI